MTKPHITADELKKKITYDPKSGIFTWLRKDGKSRTTDAWNTRNAGQVAGTSHSAGYQSITVNGIHYLSHRLAWLYVYGKWPTYHIDHINRDRTDNRIENLRDVTAAANHINTKHRIPTQSGYKNVYFHKAHNLYQAKIMRNGKQISFGYFKTAEEAATAVSQGKNRIDGGASHN